MRGYSYQLADVFLVHISSDGDYIGGCILNVLNILSIVYLNITPDFFLLFPLRKLTRTQKKLRKPLDISHSIPIISNYISNLFPLYPHNFTVSYILLYTDNSHKPFSRMNCLCVHRNLFRQKFVQRRGCDFTLCGNTEICRSNRKFRCFTIYIISFK